jgi:cytochrome c553
MAAAEKNRPSSKMQSMAKLRSKKPIRQLAASGASIEINF